MWDEDLIFCVGPRLEHVWEVCLSMQDEGEHYFCVSLSVCELKLRSSAGCWRVLLQCTAPLAGVQLS